MKNNKASKLIERMIALDNNGDISVGALLTTDGADGHSHSNFRALHGFLPISMIGEVESLAEKELVDVGTILSVLLQIGLESTKRRCSLLSDFASSEEFDVTPLPWFNEVLKSENVAGSETA